ncbi:MAG: ATP-binding cassette domain-containing protein [Pseudomonadales bacterium]|jgi:molybdate transport system ATP-binding protein|nr:ATP-binding cassette domain-containing protein [Pseudomonadales bacterium]MCP5321953.1 ATP-binding cassette domain-containing protein [Pseudomonadales bacterium]
MNAHDAWLALERVSLRLHGRLFLRDFSWQAHHGEQWAVLGPNGAGKTVLARLIGNELQPAGGTLYRAPAITPQTTAWVSFEAQRALCAEDARHDIADFLEEAVDPGTTVGALLAATARDPQRVGTVCARLGISALRERGVRFLSSGEARRTLFARALLMEPRLLVLDNPYEGVDAASRGVLRTCVDELLAGPTHVLLLTRRVQDIASRFTHVLLLENGAVLDCGPRAEVLGGAAFARLQAHATPIGKAPLPAATEEVPAQRHPGPVIELRNVHAHYGGHAVLDGVSLRMDADEHLCIAGPNGCGKSTLLALICGDNPRAYGQHVSLFGRARGSGESVWEIKQRFGIVSNQLHLDYPSRTRARDVVASGCFDTLGLYDTCGPLQTRLVTAWLDVLGLGARADARFDALSFGEQRMMLIARAMVKYPPLLILDEPCSGLDEANRTRVLELIDRIGRETRTQLLYVSHESDEMPGCITRRVEFRPNPTGGYTLVSSPLA